MQIPSGTPTIFRHLQRLHRQLLCFGKRVGKWGTPKTVSNFATAFAKNAGIDVDIAPPFSNPCASVIAAKTANDYHFKTGQRK
jgi:hypothetical protein